MKSPKHLLRLCLLGLLAVGLSPSLVNHALADDDDLTFTPIADGGTRWTVNPDALAYDSNRNSTVGVTRRPWIIMYNPIATKRTGCLLNSPWIPTTGKSDVLVFPGIEMTLNSPPLWEKEDYNWRWPHEDIFEVWVDVKPVGKPAYTRKYSIKREDVPFVLKWDLSHSFQFYRGQIKTDVWSSRPLVFSPRTNEDGQVRVRICNVGPEIPLWIEDVTIEVLPAD